MFGIYSGGPIAKMWPRFFTGAMFVIALSTSAILMAQQPSGAVMFPSPNSVLVVGRITAKLVDDVIGRSENRQIKRLIINSPGGEGAAGIRLGNWVFKEKLEVEIVKLCMSACANYVFLAGIKKIIHSGALVIWHGSAEQANFRERDSKYDQIAEKQLDSSLDSDESSFLATNKKVVEHSKSVRAAQRVFFQQIGVDEYLTRIGQEPTPFKAAWTVSVESMEKFGVKNVSAPANYGSPEYVLQAYRSIGLRYPPIAVGFNQFGSVVNLTGSPSPN